MKKRSILHQAIIICFALSACQKKADVPPLTLLSAGSINTVNQLKGIATCTNSCKKRFSGDSYLIGIVLADELLGNFNKEVYLRDRHGEGAIRLSFLSSKSTFFVGDSLRILLKGFDVNINSSTGMLEIDSIDHEKHVVKFGKGPAPAPLPLVLSQLTSTQPYSHYYCDLVQISGVGFVSTDTNQVWADAVNQSASGRLLQDCGGNQVLVKTSYNAHFAAQKTPTGTGSIIGIATAYGSSNQLIIRHPAEVRMNGPACSIYLKKDFNDLSLSSGGWSQAVVTNTAVIWTASSFGNSTFAKISGYIGSNTNSENWLISPAINLGASTNPVLSFQTAAKYSGTPLEVWLSSDYSSGLPASANWTQLGGFSLSPSSGNYVWTPSGNIPLTAFRQNGIRIAFKYRSTTSGSTTYEVDDIYVREN
jgi:hypothetical protein